MVTPRPPSQGRGTLLQLVLWLAVPTPGKGGVELGKAGVSWFEEAGTWAFGLPSPGAGHGPREAPEQAQARPLLGESRSLHHILAKSTFFTDLA